MPTGILGRFQAKTVTPEGDHHFHWFGERGGLGPDLNQMAWVVLVGPGLPRQLEGATFHPDGQAQKVPLAPAQATPP